MEDVHCRSCCDGATLGAPRNRWSVVREVAGGEMGNMKHAIEDVIICNSASKFQVANQNRPGWVVSGHQLVLYEW